MDQSVLEEWKTVELFRISTGNMGSMLIVFERGYSHQGSFLIEYFYRFGHDTWNTLSSKLNFLSNLVPEPLPLFLGYSHQINDFHYTESDDTMPIIDWMTRFDLESVIKE
jgi:hypothetical protein